MTYKRQSVCNNTIRRTNLARSFTEYWGSSFVYQSMYNCTLNMAQQNYKKHIPVKPCLHKNTVSPKTDSTAHLCVSGSKLTAQEESCRWYTVGGAEGWRKDAHQVRPCWVAANVCLAHLRQAQLRWVDVPRDQWHTCHRDLHP